MGHLPSREPSLYEYAFTETGFEYRYHTADVQIHAHGLSLSQLFANSIFAIFHYMTDLNHVCKRLEERADGVPRPMVPVVGHEISVEEDTLERCLMKALAEALYLFHADKFVACRVIVLETNIRDEDELEDENVSEGAGSS